MKLLRNTWLLSGVLLTACMPTVCSSQGIEEFTVTLTFRTSHLDNL